MSGTVLPVIAIDGPSASGKGTIARVVADHFGFHYLDSGAIYRALALAARRAGTDDTDLVHVARNLDLRFSGEAVLLDGEDATDEVRSEDVGNLASRIATIAAVREALLARQRAFRIAPGLVADGRDMASVVFPDAVIKVFVAASVAERARRRAWQLARAAESAKGLMGKEKDDNIAALFESFLGPVTADLEARDRRDSERAAAPLRMAEGARYLDTTNLNAAQAAATVIDWAGAALRPA
ncbi:MAG: (d)CMP kinase [Burkholderiales bacterium]|nr:(d)CMP kinase [Burkholderiales bacterium]